MTARLPIIHLVRVDVKTPTLSDPDKVESLRVSNATGSPYPVDIEWGTYVPVGAALRIDGLENGSSLEARNFSVTLGATSDRIIGLIRGVDTADAGVCIHEARGEPLGDGTTLWREPTLVVLGRIGQIASNYQGVTAECYTVSTDLDSAITPNLWEDSQQNQYVLPRIFGEKTERTDRGFAHTTGVFEGVITA